MAASGVLTIVLGALLTSNAVERLGIDTLVLAPPTAGTTLAAYGLVTRRHGLAFGGPLLVAMLHAGVGGLLAGEIGAVATCITWGITAVLAAPMLVVIGVVRGRSARDTGDVLLGWAGAWILALGALATLTVANDGVASAVWPALIGAMGAAAMGLAFARGSARRTWSERVARGEVEGFRARPLKDGEPEAALDALYGRADHAHTLIERLETGPAAGAYRGAAYRDGFVAVPVVRVPLFLAASDPLG